MTEMLKFEHGQTGGPIYLFPDLIFGCLHSAELKLVCILGSGGAAIPVAGSLEDVKQKIIQAKQTNKEVRDGNAIS